MVESYRWNHVKTDKFFVESSGGLIWWDQPGSPARPPARPRPPHPARRPAPSAAATPRRTAELHSPPARSVSLSPANGQKIAQTSDFLVVDRNYGFLRLQMIPPANYQRPSQRPRHIFRRCQQMASHLAVAPLPRATAPASPMICRRQPS
jgi:hypothetical protein